jgi:hypothetical protein
MRMQLLYPKRLTLNANFMFQTKIGIDLGTANTLVHLPKKRDRD